jgi:casein kinase 1
MIENGTLRQMDRIVGTYYRLRRRIGAGSFGEIYSAEHIHTHRKVAVKLESIKSRVPQLCYEAKLYQLLQGGIGIPRLFWHGSEELQNVLVIELLGKSLEDLFVRCHRHLSLKTVLMLADQMISCVEYLHNKNFIHRDIKPDNFVMGTGPTSNQVFIIDYGLAKKYCDQHTQAHIPYAEGKSLTGTARYASVGALRGTEQSRRDDLEALGYVWVYLLRGSLPWMGLTGRDQQQKYDRICISKAQVSFDELCRGFPNEFVRYFQTVRTLRFPERPNYTELRHLFRALFIKQGFVYDYQYDWTNEAATRTAAPPPAPPAVAIPPTLSSQLIARRGGSKADGTAEAPQSTTAKQRSARRVAAQPREPDPPSRGVDPLRLARVGAPVRAKDPPPPLRGRPRESKWPRAGARGGARDGSCRRGSGSSWVQPQAQVQVQGSGHNVAE